MGILSKLKNSITGGWAEVSLDAATGARGENLHVTVHVQVKGEPIEPTRIYLKLRCNELVDIPNYRALDRDDAGDVDYINVRKHDEIYEREVQVTGPQQLDANSSHDFEADIELPDHLPASYRGRHCSLEWELFAGLDMKGNDPDSGWTDIEVR